MSLLPSEDGGEDAVRFSGTASEAAAAVVGVGSLGGSAGSTTATAEAEEAALGGGGVAEGCLAGQERSSGCICVSAALILASVFIPLSFAGGKC